MSNDYLEKIEMSFEEAQNIVSNIVEQKLRWGKMYDGSEYRLGVLVDAMVVLAYHENEDLLGLRKSLALANRQLGASAAREAKRAKKESKNGN